MHADTAISAAKQDIAQHVRASAISNFFCWVQSRQGLPVRVRVDIHAAANTLQHTATHCNTLQHIATLNFFCWIQSRQGLPVTVRVDIHTAIHCNTLHTHVYCCVFQCVDKVCLCKCMWVCLLEWVWVLVYVWVWVGVWIWMWAWAWVWVWV